MSNEVPKKSVWRVLLLYGQSGAVTFKGKAPPGEVGLEEGDGELEEGDEELEGGDGELVEAEGELVEADRELEEDDVEVDGGPV